MFEMCERFSRHKESCDLKKSHPVRLSKTASYQDKKLVIQQMLINKKC